MKINKKIIAVIATPLLALSLMTTASADREFGEIYTQCGIGAIIFKKNETLAAISNITWDLGTTAFSSNMSSEENCKGSAVAKASFIHSSYTALEQDIAKGEGQHLNALMDIMKCDTKARKDVVQAIRTDFSKTVSAVDYSSATAQQKSKQLYDMTNTGKAASCGTKI
ncbi:MAG: DUF3015 family protein [Cocleimonas sp.]|nr:DUF3015 family protein [Cocleimonas sp.]